MRRLESVERSFLSAAAKSKNAANANRKTSRMLIVAGILMATASFMLAGNLVIELTDCLRAAGINPF